MNLVNSKNEVLMAHTYLRQTCIILLQAYLRICERILKALSKWLTCFSPRMDSDIFQDGVLDPLNSI